MKNVYGYILNGSFIETGLTENGAKIAATRAASRFVGYRSYINNMYVQTAFKKEGVWFYQKKVTDYQERMEKEYKH